MNHKLNEVFFKQATKKLIKKHDHNINKLN